MGKRVGIVQSNYIPWKGYFDLIHLCDEFILMDEVQFTRRDWRNRNRIKSAAGTIWLTIPVVVKGKYHQSISETLISEVDWNTRHWKTVEHCYRRAAHFSEFRDPVEELYRGATETHLSQLNFRFLKGICGLLGIRTKLSWSSDYPHGSGKTERLVQLCRAAGATEYLTGPSAGAYLDPAFFAEAGIEIQYMSYNDYPQYEQLYPPFDHYVSVLDLLFNQGTHAADYMLSFGRRDFSPVTLPLSEAENA
jgi:hypothetical protein